METVKTVNTVLENENNVKMNVQINENEQVFINAVTELVEMKQADCKVLSVQLIDMWGYLGHPDDTEDQFTEDDRYKRHQLYAQITTTQSLTEYQTKMDIQHFRELNSEQDVLQVFKQLQTELSEVCPVALLVQNDLYELME